MGLPLTGAEAAKKAMKKTKKVDNILDEGSVRLAEKGL